MIELTPEIRNAARALIIQQDRLLLLRKEGGGRDQRFALPGGAQDPGESLTDALNRECIEEIGTAVEAAELVHVADFIKLRDTQPPTRRHVVDFLFRCTVSDDYSPRNGHRPDKHQVEVLWVELSALNQTPLFPHYLASCIPRLVDADRTIYLGKFDDNATAKGD
jgi:ADP-ribose pyrophosphatase YjhB (NUDIX family)